MFASLQTSTDNFANADPDETPRRIYIVSNSVNDFWMKPNPNLQEWVSPNSEMEESFQRLWDERVKTNVNKQSV